MRIRRWLAGALLTVVAGSARGQEQQIPRELALALIPYGGSDGGEILVGQLPPDLATTFNLPSGARVLGSFVSLTVAQQPPRTELQPADVLTHYGKQLDSAGWKAVGTDKVTVSGSWLNEKTGREVTITIVQLPNLTGCYEVSLRATAARSTR